jgi:hypothetical protein
MFQTKLYVDEAWMKGLSLGLLRFRKVKPNVYVCRCPFCGDSKKSTTTTRFFFYVRKGSLNVQCKNCNYSRSFYNFVFDYSPQRFEEYKKETLLHSFTTKKKKNPVEKPINKLINKKEEKLLTCLNNTINCATLPDNHPAITYLCGRGFKKAQIERLLYTDDFKSVCMQLSKSSSKNLLENEPRIVIPFYDESGNIKLIQGRALKNSKMKYITIKTHDEVTKIYGLENLDKTKTTYCVEGPLDSLFVENCVATCDANLTRSDANVLIFDNESRNEQIVKLIESAIDQGRSVVIWPNSTDKKQDINDMIQSGISQKLLMGVIRKRTFKGLMARLEFNKWKKV